MNGRRSGETQCIKHGTCFFHLCLSRLTSANKFVARSFCARTEIFSSASLNLRLTFNFSLCIFVVHFFLEFVNDWIVSICVQVSVSRVRLVAFSYSLFSVEKLPLSWYLWFSRCLYLFNFVGSSHCSASSSSHLCLFALSSTWFCLYCERHSKNWIEKDEKSKKARTTQRNKNSPLGIGFSWWQQRQQCTRNTRTSIFILICSVAQNVMAYIHTGTHEKVCEAKSRKNRKKCA